MRPSGEITDEMNALTLELNEHRKDVALMERLRKAQAEATRLVKRLDALTAELVEATDHERKQRAKQEQMTYRNFVVTARYGTGQIAGEDFPAGFTIAYERFVSGPYGAGYSPRESPGFMGMEQAAVEAMLNHYPESLPIQISRLAPGDAHAALDKYMRYLQRGFFS